jgi:uncharacterized protein YbaP (TraB family)
MRRAFYIIRQRRLGLAAAVALTYAWLLVSGLYPSALHAQEKSFLWKVSKNEKNVFLLGSIHYLKKENFPLRKSILDALDSSKRLVLEIDLNSASAGSAQRLTVEKALYRDGATLPQNIEQETYRLAAQRAAQLGIDMQVLNPMKPWFVALTMMAIKFQQLGLDPTLGVDRYLAARAKDGGIPTSGLETLEFQIGLMDQLSKSDQELMLRETVAELDLLDQNFNQIVQSWLKGDGASLEVLLLASMREYPDLYQKIIVDRNRRWLPQIEKMIAQGDDAMVVVGAAHLVGQDGVIEMLKFRGYNLEQQ